VVVFASVYPVGVRGVVNTCDEYGGPVRTYEKFGIQQLYLPVIDYTSPTDSQIDRCVDFCEKMASTGKTVYIHCKGAWFLSIIVFVSYLGFVSFRFVLFSIVLRLLMD
jgi:atypical dual specificity phosphatase